ncbi:MAG: tetratricopeptide repeat protein [Bacteroidota bacterium]
MSLCLFLVACSSESESGTGKVTNENPTDSSVTQVKDSAEKTIDRLTEQIRYSPKSWNLWYDRSLLWYEKGNTARAMEDINKAIELHVMNPDGYHTRGFYYYVQNKDEEALRDFKRAAEVGSDNPETFYHIGQIFFFRKDFSEAENAYGLAIKMDSMEPTYYFARGFMYEEQNKTDKAIGEYETAIKRNPFFIKALLALHDIYLLKKKNADAAYAYNERVMQADSLHPMAHFNQGNFFIQRANVITDELKAPEFEVLLKVAVSEFSKCLEQDVNFVQAYYNRGYAWYLLAGYEKAMADFSQVIELDPFNEKAFFMKASIQEFKGEYAAALSNYQQAFKLNPDFSDAEVAVKELSARQEQKSEDASSEEAGS